MNKEAERIVKSLEQNGAVVLRPPYADKYDEAIEVRAKVLLQPDPLYCECLELDKKYCEFCEVVVIKLSDLSVILESSGCSYDCSYCNED